MWILGKTITLFYQFRARDYLFYHLCCSSNHPLALLCSIGQRAFWSIQFFQALLG